MTRSDISVQLLGHVLKGKAHTRLLFLFSCPSGWNRDVLAGGGTAILPHEVKDEC